MKQDRPLHLVTVWNPFYTDDVDIGTSFSASGPTATWSISQASDFGIPRHDAETSSRMAT